MKKHVILLLAANPRDTGHLALDEEVRSIHVELKRSRFRDRFDLVTRWAVEPLDLLREVRELKPTIVHFSGHGTSSSATIKEPARRDIALAYTPADGERPGLGGFVVRGASGEGQVVTLEAFAETLGSVGARVRLVVLNACYTAPAADVLLAHVQCVVGMTGAIRDDAARSFALGFYGGLAEYESVAAAFQQGKAAIRLQGLPDVDQPQLRVRNGVDAAQLIPAAPVRLDLPCPYPGMRAYTAEDADSFHGRETEIAELLARLRAGEREIFVIGPSGSGKSSLVTAGVLPRLARGVAGLGAFAVRELRPGERPAAQLDQALGGSGGEPMVASARVAALLADRESSASLLIVVDQLEELFTLARADERARFLDALRTLGSERRCIVLFTLRADFFGALMESTLWRERRGQLSRVEISPLTNEALRFAIEAPARTVGVTIEPELIERLMADAASEPGILPLLQETLVQLWNVRAEQTLTLADYEAFGDGGRSGIAIALARRADASLRRLNPGQTDIARRILLRLISFGEGRSDTRRQQLRAQLRAVGDSATDFDFVLQTMVDDRLLTADEDVASEPRVDLAHEIIISAWPKLAEWTRSHRLDEQRRRRFEADATEWVEYGRGARGLLDPVKLADAEQWQHTESAVQLGRSADVAALIASSRAAQTKQRMRRFAASGAGLSVVAVAVAAALLAARGEAETARRGEAEAQRLAVKNRQLADESNRFAAQSYLETGRQLVVGEHYQEAIPYFVAARERGDESAPLQMMFTVAKRHLPLSPPLEHRDLVLSAAFSPDGKRVVTASADKTARVWDAATGTPITRALEHQAEVRSAAFSPDGTRVVTASWDKTARVWDAVTGTPLTGPLVHKDELFGAAFSPDGTRVVTASRDKTARVWDAATGKPITRPLEHHGGVVSAAFSPDGTRVVTASWDKTARVWDAATGKPITRPLKHQDDVLCAAFSPDGTRVVTASKDNTARVWDAATGTPLTGSLVHQSWVVSAEFSPEGMRVVTASDDKTARVWDAATGTPLTGPLVHQDEVLGAAFSPDGTRVVTASADKTARVWDAATGTPLTSPLVHQELVSRAAFSPDGTRVITASDDKTARVWDAASGTPLIVPLVDQGEVSGIALSPDGARVFTVSWGNTGRVWDAVTGKPLSPRLENPGTMFSATFSADDTRVVVTSWGKTARVWDAVTGKPLTGRLEHGDVVVSAAFSTDGTRLVTASSDKTARVWDAMTGKPLTGPLEHGGALVSAAFSADGSRVLTASWDKTARVWDAVTGKPLTPPLEHGEAVVSAAFSPDGTRVVTASLDNTARVWDAATGKPLTRPLEHQAAVRSARFSSDGTRVVTASLDNTARVWDAATGKPLTRPLEHHSSVWCAAFSPDGTRVVTASLDKTARVWDVATGQPLTSPLKHQRLVESAAFSADGMRVVTVSDDKTARVWDVRPDAGTLADWERIAERSPFVLNAHGILVRRSDLLLDDRRVTPAAAGSTGGAPPATSLPR